MSKQYIKSLLLCIIITSSYAIVFFESSFVQSIGREDGPIENIGAIFFIIASCLFFICYKISVGRGNDFWIMNTNRNLFYLLLAGLFLICFGEEISWGQRIFGWNTPETWTDINAQKETNFHNLWVFQTTNPDGSRKSFLELFLNMSRLFSMFWLFYCVLVPMVNHYSEKAKTLFDQVSLPI
jgi:hypothetical protein